MKTEINTATENEFPEILEMMEEFYGIFDYRFNRESTKKNLCLFACNSNLGRIWTVNFNRAIAGYAVLAFGFSFERNGRDAFIDELFIKQEYRQKGIGKAVMGLIEKEAIELGVNTIHLEVEKHNEGGTKLYRGRGFRDNGRILLSKKIIP